MGRYQTDEEISGHTDEVTTFDQEETPPEAPEQEGTPEEEGEGQGDEVTPGEETPPAEPPAEPEEDTYTIKIGGKEVSMPVSELAKGYMRQDDYTRKTMELAQQRASLTDAATLIAALESNPAQTLQVLAHHYQVDMGEVDGTNGYQGPSPEQQRIQELESWQQAEVQRQREAAVDVEINRLHRDYGEFDDDELFRYAVENNVGHLETALRSMQFDIATGNGQVRRVDKRRVAAQAGGQAHSTSVRPKVPASEIRTFHDAYEAAKAELRPGT